MALPAVLVSCGAALLAGATAAEPGLADPMMHQAGSEGPRPAAAIPLRPAPLPGGIRFDFSVRTGPSERPDWPVALSDPGRPAPGAVTVRPPLTSRFSERLMARLEVEARRYRSEHPFDVSGERFPIDSIGEEQRAREAERIFTRALDKTLDDQLERLARTSLGLGGLLEWLDDFGDLRLGSGSRGTARNDLRHPATPSHGWSPTRRVPAFHAGFGLRLGAHPRLLLKTEFLGIRGRLEVPVLEEALRLTFERPLGPRSRAALSGGLSRDGDDWATITLNIGF